MDTINSIFPVGVVQTGDMVTDDSESGDTTQTNSSLYFRRGCSSSITRRRFLHTIGGGVAATSLAGCLSTGETLPDTIRIGAMGPTDSPMGQSIINAATLAVEEINAGGGIDGTKLALLTRNTKGDPKTARSVYRELTQKKDVHATTGIFGSEVLLSLFPLIAEAETIHLGSGAATHEATLKVHEQYSKYKYFFRVGPPSTHHLTEHMAAFAREEFPSLGWNRIALLAEEFKWAESIAEELNSQFMNSSAVESVITEHISPDTTDFASVYDTLETVDIDGVFTILGHIGTKSLSEWASLQPSFGYGGIHGPAQNPSYYEATNGAARYAYSWASATPESEITEETIPFANSYHEMFDGYPVSTGYITYDAVHMLKKAIKIATSVEPEQLISEFEAMTHTGTTGEIEFVGKLSRYTHDVKVGPGFVHGVFFQWQERENRGEQVVIRPQKLATGEYERPAWIRE
jgi:branched-chain amino acid transport system substrate-binding protein